ncbi:hypothetical protein D3C72_2297090 [compost metagenome]
MVQHLGDVEADQGRFEAQGVLVIVEDPAERAAALPALEPCADAAGVALAEQAPQGGDGALPPGKGLQRRDSMIDRPRLGHRQGFVRAAD